MLLAQRTLFANANLAKTPLYQAPSQEIRLDAARKIGVGFYPLKEAEKLVQRRESERDALRARFLAAHSLVDKGQRLLVYLGGNNEVYFSSALPACLRLFTEAMKETDLSNYIVVFQQHPGAKARQKDAALCQSWISQQGQHAQAPQWILSELRTDEALVAADAVLYYQTSMGPQCALAHIPTIQVGHEVYEDVLVKAGLCAVATKSHDLSRALAHLEVPSASDEDLKQRLGIRADWIEQMTKVGLKRLRPSSRICDLDNLYQPGSCEYSLPRSVLTSFLDGKAFDHKESYSPEERERLERDITTMTNGGPDPMRQTTSF